MYGSYLYEVTRCINVRARVHVESFEDGHIAYVAALLCAVELAEVP